jgi:hypothetical protein
MSSLNKGFVASLQFIIQNTDFNYATILNCKCKDQHFAQRFFQRIFFSFLFPSFFLYLRSYLIFPFKGSGKTHAFKKLEKSIIKTEKRFPSTYLKPVVVNGKPTESELSSIVTHTNHIGLRQHLVSNNKILLSDDADLIAETYGLYNVNDCTKEHE